MLKIKIIIFFLLSEMYHQKNLDRCHTQLCDIMIIWLLNRSVTRVGPLIMGHRLRSTTTHCTYVAQQDPTDYRISFTEYLAHSVPGFLLTQREKHSEVKPLHL